jgi:CheY-like chemotaxis protein
VHLLIIEDEDAIRSALGRGLVAPGRTVVTAASLSEAWDRISERRPDAIITDLTLPDGRGLDLAAEVGVPFVLMTGYGTFDDAVGALRHGAVDFFTKPVAIRDLRRAVERLATHVVGGTTVVDAAVETVVLVSADGVQQIGIGSAAWSDAGSARSAYDRMLHLVPGVAARQVLAECLQAVPSGRVVVNHVPGCCRLQIDSRQPVTWSPVVRTIISERARRVAWQPAGLLVEVAHG